MVVVVCTQLYENKNNDPQKKALEMGIEKKQIRIIYFPIRIDCTLLTEHFQMTSTPVLTGHTHTHTKTQNKNTNTVTRKEND